MDSKFTLGIFFIAFCICLKVIGGIIEAGISNSNSAMLLIWSAATLYTGLKLHTTTVKLLQKKAISPSK